MSEHIVELLKSHAATKDMKLSNDLIKYVVGLFDTAKSSSLIPQPSVDTMAVKEEPGSNVAVQIEQNDMYLETARSKLFRRSPGSNSSETTSSPPRATSAPAGHGLKRIFEEPSKDIVKYVMGKRGGCQIVWQGHRYTRDRTRNDQTYWACVLKRPPYRCKGRISTKSSFVTSATAHNHEHQTAKSQTARLVHQIKQKVYSAVGDIDATDIVIHCLHDFKYGDVKSNEELPPFDTLVKMCKRIIKNKKKIPEEPALSMTSPFAAGIFKTSPIGGQSALGGVERTRFPNELQCYKLIKYQQASMLNFGNPHLMANSTLSNCPLIATSLPTTMNSMIPPNVRFLSPPHEQLQSPLSSHVTLQHSPPLNLLMSDPVTLSTNTNFEDDLVNMEDDVEAMDDDQVETVGDDVYDAMLKRGMSSIREIRSCLDDLEHLYRARVSEIKLIEEERAECKEDNQLKEKRIKTLQSEVSKLDVALKVAQEGLQKARSTSEDKVERSLIKTFFTQYLTAPENRKPEVLRLMTSILNFSEEDLEQLHKGKDNKWLANFFKPAPNSSPQAPGESFSELFVSFLETEANRGMMGQIPASTPVTQHTRTLSASSNRSIPSNVSSSTESPGTLHHSPIMSAAPMVVPNSLADLLNKTR